MVERIVVLGGGTGGTLTANRLHKRLEYTFSAETWNWRRLQP